MDVLSGEALAAKIAGVARIDKELSNKLLQLFEQLMHGFFKEQSGVRLTDFLNLSASEDETNSLGQKAIVDRMLEKVTLPLETMEGWLGAFSKVAQDELLHEHAIDLDRVGTLQLSMQKPQMAYDPVSKKQLILPGQKQVSLSLDRELAEIVGRETLFPKLAAPFQNRIDKIKLAGVIAVVPKMDRFAEILDFHLKDAGWEAHFVFSVDEALEKVSSGKTFLIFLDDQVIEYQNFIRKAKFNRKISMVPVIVMHRPGWKREAPTDLAFYGDQEVVQPFEIKPFLDLADSELERSSEEGVIFLQEIHFQFPSDQEIVDQSCEMVLEILKSSGLGEEGQQAVMMAYREAAGNAAQHGNKFDKSKPVDVLYLLDRNKISMVIRDEGPGFDHEGTLIKARKRSALDSARQRHKEGDIGGLGSMMMLRCMDKVEYNNAGNEVVLTKYVR